MELHVLVDGILRCRLKEHIVALTDLRLCGIIADDLGHLLRLRLRHMEVFHQLLLCFRCVRGGFGLHLRLRHGLCHSSRFLAKPGAVLFGFRRRISNQGNDLLDQGLQRTSLSVSDLNDLLFV